MKYSTMILEPGTLEIDFPVASTPLSHRGIKPATMKFEHLVMVIWWLRLPAIAGQAAQPPGINPAKLKFEHLAINQGGKKTKHIY